jgi:hypothetical protein
VEDGRSARDSARKFLVDELIGGARTVKDLKESARDAGLSWPTIMRAKTDLGVKTRKINKKGGERGEGHWEWRMP